MSNLITSMWTAVSGLNASQAAINTTAHNLSNINTDGYTRQQNICTDTNYITVYTASGTAQVGNGSTTAHVRQLRNEFYDKSFREESGRKGFYDAQYNVISEVQDLFGETEGVSYQDVLTNIWESMEELSKEPESSTTRATFVYNISDFLSRSNDISSQLQAYQKSLNTEISDVVNNINSLGEKIYSLNKQISTIEATGMERANDLRDQRNNYLDDLSKLVDIDYYEDTSGVVKVSVEGSPFVEELSVNKMSTTTPDISTGLVSPIWSQLGTDVFNTKKFVSITEGTDSGYLKGLIMARGTRTTNFSDIPVPIVEPSAPSRTDFISTETGAFDQNGYDAAMAQYQVDKDNYNIALNKYNNEKDQYNSVVDVSSIMTVMAEFDNLVNGIVTAINDVLCPNKEIQVIDSNGNITTMSVLDEENAPLGMDEDKTKGEELIKRKNTSRYTEVTVDILKTDDKGKILYDSSGNPITETKTVRKYNEEDPDDINTLYTTSQLEINDVVKNDYTKLALGEIDGNGGYAYSGVVVDLIGIWDEEFSTLSPNTLTGYTFQEYYTALIGDIGNVGYSMENMVTSQQTLMDEIDNTRKNYSAVSSDEELGNLIKFQNAYNAASRYFNVIDEMVQNLITQLGS